MRSDENVVSGTALNVSSTILAGSRWILHGLSNISNFEQHFAEFHGMKAGGTKRGQVC